MDAPPPLPPSGQPGFPLAPLKCDLPDVTAELLRELDTDVLPALTNTAFTLDLRNATTLATSASPASVTAGRFSVEISEATMDNHPCYQVMASLLLRGGGSVKEKTSVQVIANVSTQLDTLRESRVVTVGGKHRFTRNVWGVGITAPGSTRVSSAVPGSARAQSAAAATASTTSSKPASASSQPPTLDTEAGQQQSTQSNNLDDYLNAIPEDTATTTDDPDADDVPKNVPIPSDDAPPSSASSTARTPRPTSSRPPSSSTGSARPRPPSSSKPRAHYLIQHQSLTLAGSPDGEDLVTLDSTHVVDHAACPGLLFSGSQLIFLLLVAFHVQSTGLSVPEVFVTHAYANDPEGGVAALTLTSDPVRPQVVGGLARKLVGVRVDRAAAGKAAEGGAYDLVGHLSQWYFAPWVTPGDTGDRPSSAAEVLAGAGCGLELVAMTRVAGADGIVTDPKGVAGGGKERSAEGAERVHPADDPDLGGAIEVQSMYYELKAEEERNLESILHTRPELTAMLTDFMRAVLMKKPKDVYAYAREHFALLH